MQFGWVGIGESERGRKGENMTVRRPEAARVVSAEWPTLTNKKEVQSFIGFTNFYHRFIEAFSHHARALFNLMKKDVRFVWSLAQQGAFKKLKLLVMSAPILTLPDEGQPYRVEADSSGVATGTVLSQLLHEDGKWHPVAFLSKSLSPVERNYEIHDTEMLAIVRALEEWRHYLEGARHPIKIWTDHKSLEYFRTSQKLNWRQARWSLYLSRFDFPLGKSMGKPDALSRRADHGKGLSSDNKDITLLLPDVFRIHALAGLTTAGEETSILRNIQRSTHEVNLKEPVAIATRELQRSLS